MKITLMKADDLYILTKICKVRTSTPAAICMFVDITFTSTSQ